MGPVMGAVSRSYGAPWGSAGGKAGLLNRRRGAGTATEETPVLPWLGRPAARQEQQASKTRPCRSANKYGSRAGATQALGP